MRKLPADIGIMGECEEALIEIAGGNPHPSGTTARTGDGIHVRGGLRATDLTSLPPLAWNEDCIARHGHHHHRFDCQPEEPGAEVEAPRGCPYHCTFCAKENCRDAYRRRSVEAVLEEIDRLTRHGVTYIYFIDEIFLPNACLLAGLARRNIRFGVQTRIDLWKPEMIRLLGDAGCVSVEARVESLTRAGRDELDKRCKLSTDELRNRLILARQNIPFVQANLIETPLGDKELVQPWHSTLISKGVWANDPGPLLSCWGSPDYRRLWGVPDDYAWERAVSYYLENRGRFSEIQEQRPMQLETLENASAT